MGDEIKISHSINSKEVSSDELNDFTETLQGTLGRDLTPFAEDGKITHEEFLKLLDVNDDGYFGPDDEDALKALVGENYSRVVKDLNDYDFDIPCEADHNIHYKEEIAAGP